MFKAGHSYVRAGGLDDKVILCIDVTKTSACFRLERSFSNKSQDRADGYVDLGILGWRGRAYAFLSKFR